MIYTVWSGGDNGITMTLGTEVPKFINGQNIEEINIVLFQFETDTWAETIQKEKELMGWN